MVKSPPKWFLVGILVLLAALTVLYWGPLHDFAVRVTRFMLDKEGARAQILAHPHSLLYFIGLQAIQVIISPIPGELSSFLAGLVFGWGPGFFYATIGLTIGSLINVCLGRIFERVFLEKIIPARILDSFEKKAKKWGLFTVFMLFLFPGAPKDTLCYLFGLSRIPIWVFLLVSSVARMPGTLVLCLQGDKVVEGDWTVFIVLTLGAIALIVPAYLFKDRIFKIFGIDDQFLNKGD